MLYRWQQHVTVACHSSMLHACHIVPPYDMLCHEHYGTPNTNRCKLTLCGCAQLVKQLLSWLSTLASSRLYMQVALMAFCRVTTRHEHLQMTAILSADVGWIETPSRSAERTHSDDNIVGALVKEELIWAQVRTTKRSAQARAKQHVPQCSQVLQSGSPCPPEIKPSQTQPNPAKQNQTTPLHSQQRRSTYPDPSPTRLCGPHSPVAGCEYHSPPAA
jgi:hypothetical protein